MSNSSLVFGNCVDCKFARPITLPNHYMRKYGHTHICQFLPPTPMVKSEVYPVQPTVKPKDGCWQWSWNKTTFPNLLPDTVSKGAPDVYE